MTEVQSSEENKVAKLKRQRAGKKGSITKRIEQLNRLLSEGGSRTKIKYLHSAMIEVHNATKAICEQINVLMDSDDTDWIEEVDLNVDTCTAEVNEYLEARKDDAESSVRSFTESWVRKHEPEANVADLAASLADLTTVARAPYSNTGGLDPAYQGGNYVNSTLNPLQSAFSSWREPQNNINCGSSLSYSELANGARHGRLQTVPYTSTLVNPSFGAHVRFQSGLQSSDNASVMVSGVSRSNQFQQLSSALPGVSQQPSSFQFGTHLGPTTNTVFSSGPRHPTDAHNGASQTNSHTRTNNDADSWIDELDENRLNQRNIPIDDITPNTTMAWLVQQSLPRAQFPVFDGMDLLRHGLSSSQILEISCIYSHTSMILSVACTCYNT